MIQSTDQQLGIFIDGGHVVAICKEDFKNELSIAGLKTPNIDYSKFHQCIVSSIGNDINIRFRYFYDCFPYKGDNPSAEESRRYASKQRFFHKLNHELGYEVRKGKLQCLNKEEAKQGKKPILRQKMVDTRLSVDLVAHSIRKEITHAAIITGDSDFVPAVEEAMRENVVVWVFHGKSGHKHLKETAYACIPLSFDFLRPCMIWN